MALLKPKKKGGKARICMCMFGLHIPIWRAGDVGQATVKIAAFKRRFKRAK